MYKLVVLTDPDNADGFRLAGVDVDIVESEDQVREHLNRLLDLKLEVTKKTKNDNENIYFNRRIETDRAAGSFRQEAGDALVPF